MAAMFLAVGVSVSSCDYTSRLPANYPCQSDDQCSSGACRSGMCAAASPRAAGEACLDNGDCQSFLCVNGTCVTSIRSRDGGPDTGPLPRCGDGKRNGKEPCDGKDLGGRTCQSQGFTGGKLSCVSCKLDTAACYRVYAPKGVVVGKSNGKRSDPAVVFGGGGYMVAWTDERMGSKDIFASRVDRGGQVLNVKGIPVTTRAGHEDQPAVAASANNYMLVWTDRRDGSEAVFGARLSNSGAILDTGGFSIGSSKKSQHQPTVAFKKDTYLVVWSDDRNEPSGDIYGARVNLSGQLVSTLPAVISTSKGGQRRPAMAVGTYAFMAAWDDTRSGRLDIYGTRIDSLGAALNPTGLAMATNAKDQQGPAITFNGTSYLLVWTDKRGANQDIYANRISLSGQPLDATGFIVSAATGDQLAPAVAARNNGDFLVVWTDYRGAPDAAIYGARVGGNGKLKDPGGVRISSAAGTQTEPAVAHDGAGKYLVVWTGQEKSKDPTISCTRFSP